MNDMVTINQNPVQRIHYKGAPVITLRMMDELHQRVDGTARRTFSQHKEYLIADEDYFKVPYQEWSEITAVRNTYGGKDTGQRNPITFLTQTGYLLLVKTFTDKLAWQIQRELVNGYFGRMVKEMDVETGITESAILFFDASSGKFALRNLGKQEPQAAHSQKKRKGATTIWHHTDSGNKSSVIWALLADGKPYRIKAIADVTGLSRNFCNDTIYKAYKRGRSLVRVKRGVYKRAECQ